MSKRLNLGRYGHAPLPPGVESRVYRVRAPARVHEALRGLSAAEVGALLERALRAGGDNQP